jgi:acyl-CoA reductase-like NAD-dependent aldehyde dehydrogenase
MTIRLDSVHTFVGAPVRRLLIGGAWVEAASGRTFDTRNPATGAVLARVAEGDAEDIDRGVRAARGAFDDGPWPRLRPHDRERVLLRVAELIETHAEELAQLESLDNGKPITESRAGDIPAAAQVFRYYAGWPSKLTGETNATDSEFFNYTLREPIGVCGQIIPWNFPLMMAAWKVAPALACGNVCVLKPAEETPLTALRLGELLLEAGVPPGVVNIVPGFGETAGAALVRHPLVDKIAFTGSTAVGKEIQRVAADSLKRVSLELGGKSPNIVFSDGDADAAIQGTIRGAFYNGGQVCSAGTRLFVQRDRHDEFVDRLTGVVSSMKQGDPLDPATRIGPVASEAQLERVTEYLRIGRNEGATPVIGGDRNRSPGLDSGYFVQPTIFTGVDNDMRIAREEIFGPVLSVIPFADEHDAALLGNATAYGLAAGIWTRDVAKAHRLARALRAGTVWINCYSKLDPVAPFGGYKESGYGRELGRYALDLYTQIKSVWVRI